MANNKTNPSQSSVTNFLHAVPDQRLRENCFALVEMMRTVSRAEPVMWGSSIVGFGNHHYVYESGREGDTMLIGFAPRKGKIAVYLLGGLEKIAAELSVLGKHETGKGCLYLQSLGDVNPEVLKEIFNRALEEGMRRGGHTD